MALWDETKNQIQDLIQFVEKFLQENTDSYTESFCLSLHASLLDIQNRYHHLGLLASITDNIHNGLSFDEIMEFIYNSFDAIIPYDRIGVALIDWQQQTITARWSRIRSGGIKMGNGHSCVFAQTSLAEMARHPSPQPRILNDLEDYIQQHPHSNCTKMLLTEGIRSSLTCPILINHKTIGFLFFSSFQRHTYQNAHIDIYLAIADRVAIAFNNSFLTEKLISLNQVKDDFVSMVSHELRTPLAIIKEGTAQILDRILGDISAGQERTLHSILRNINRLGRIINDLLDVSKMEAGKLELLEEPFDIIELSSSICANLKVMAASKGLELVEMYESPSQVINADRDRLTQVFMNLIQNAIQYTEKGKIEIKISYTQDSTHWSVRDTGQGISENDMAKLFNKFEQFGGSSKYHTKGTGLGLSIAKNIVELHGGKIYAESKLGEGTCFSVWIPHRSLRLLMEEKLAFYFSKTPDSARGPLFLAHFSMLQPEKVIKTLGRQYKQSLMRDLREILNQTLRGESDIVLGNNRNLVVALTEQDKTTSLGVLSRIQSLIDQHLKNKQLFDLVHFELHHFWKETGQRSDIATLFTMNQSSL